MAIQKAIVVGAGPSGLILSLLLAKQGIQITLLDAGATLDEQPRASHYASPAVYELERAGILDDVKARGIQPKDMTWRKADLTRVAGFRLDCMPKERERHSMVVLPLDQLGEILYAHLQRQPTARVRWSHRVVKVGQSENDGAWVVCETPSGMRRFEAEYVLGCDGASSTVRRELFGPEYPGETLNAQLVATNVYYNSNKFNYTDTNFIIHPQNFYMLARITQDGLHRVTYGDTPGLTREEYINRQPRRYEEILPGNPKPGDYRITNISPYRMQQRCAPSFRVGRVLLAADAAHVCNPFGGLGLTGGIADAGSLFDTLMGIHHNLVSSHDYILDKYSEVRRKIWTDVVNPISRENFQRLVAQEANTARENDGFFRVCVLAEGDEGVAGELAMGLEILRHDMTQYYDKRLEPGGIIKPQSKL